MNGFEFAAHCFARAVSSELKTVHPERLLAASGSSRMQKIVSAILLICALSANFARFASARDPAVSRVSRATRARARALSRARARFARIGHRAGISLASRAKRALRARWLRQRVRLFCAHAKRARKKNSLREFFFQSRATCRSRVKMGYQLARSGQARPRRARPGH